MGVSPAFHRRAVTVKGERGSRASVDQGTDVTESLARQLGLVDPGELPGRGEWCLVGGAGPREKRRKIHNENWTWRSRKARQGHEGPSGEISVHWVGPTLQLSIPLTS